MKDCNLQTGEEIKRFQHAGIGGVVCNAVTGLKGLHEGDLALADYFSIPIQFGSGR